MKSLPQSHWLKDRHLDYHQRQFAQPYRSTVHLERFLKDVLPATEQPFRVLDVGCGAGANMYYLSQTLINADWVGVDLNERLFAVGQELLRRQGAAVARFQFLAADFYRMDEMLLPASYDLVFSIQTLSWLPDYLPLLEQLVHVTKPGGFIFITSLFTDFLVDCQIAVTQYEADLYDQGDGPHFYNIYCFDRFCADCARLGAPLFQARDFEIDLDLSPPSHRWMGTYTTRTQEGRRLQLSGPLLLPWKFLALKVSS